MSTSPATIARTLEPPYYAVIFTSLRTEGDRGYGGLADRMMELVSTQPGFLGAESARDTNGLGITVSYWSSLESIKEWKRNEEHQAAQNTGKKTWYSNYQVRIAKVEREYGKIE